MKTRSSQRSRGVTYANVVSTLALVVAVGGTSYAAANLPKNSVGSAQIKKEAVKSADLKNNTIKGVDVRDGALTSADLAPGTIPTIPPATGATGPAGGVLAGTYPNPTLAAGAPGSAVAGMYTFGGVGATVGHYFNRFGGAPTLVRVSVGNYTINFPGSSSSITSNTIALANSPLPGFVKVNSGSGSLGVTTADVAGNPIDIPFSLAIFASGTTGGTTLPARPDGS